jgi:hypothetical protein
MKVIHQNINNPKCKHDWHVTRVHTAEEEKQGKIVKFPVFEEQCRKCDSERSVVK